MIAIVFPWMLVGDVLLFDRFTDEISATLIALSSVAIGAVVFLFVIYEITYNGREGVVSPAVWKRLATLQLILINQEEGE